MAKEMKRWGCKGPVVRGCGGGAKVFHLEKEAKEAERRAAEATAEAERKRLAGERLLKNAKALEKSGEREMAKAKKKRAAAKKVAKKK